MIIGGFDVVWPRRSFLRSERSRTARYAVPLVGVPLVGVLATASYAAWTSNGSGTAAAQAGTSTALTTSAVAVTTGLLYPGTTGDVKITINNPNPYPVRITSIAGTGTVTATGGTGTCTTTGVSFTTQNGTFDVPARVGTTDGTATFPFTGAASMTNASQDGCQNATFAIGVTLTGASNA